MPQYYFEDGDNVRRNMVTVVGGGPVPFNAILDVEFTDESTSEPVTMEEAKAWCRISQDITEDDAEITELITVARILCEKFTNISFIERTVTATLNNSCGNQWLPYGPIVGDVDTFTDSEGEAVTGVSLRGSQFKYVYAPLTDYIQITYATGYPLGIPTNLKQAVKCQIKYLYDNRGEDTATLSEQTKVMLKQVMR